MALERKTAGLLAYLALEREVPRAKLAELLWPTGTTKTARNNLRQCLHKLRRFGNLVRGEERLTLGPDVDVDVHALDSDGHAPGDAHDGGTGSLAADLLADLSFDDCPDFEEWLLLEREHIRVRWREEQTRRSDAFEALGDHTSALALAEVLLADDPLSEVAYRRVMRLHSLLGDRAAALAVFERCRAVLERELGVEPAPETAQLADAIAHGVPARARTRRTTASTPFIGREANLRSIQERLDDPECRLLSLVGIGGVGKTRLALECAALRADGTQGDVYFVPLAEVTSASRLPFALAHAVGLRFYRRDDHVRQLAEHLARRPTLLVLDAFEHLHVDGVGVVSELLALTDTLTLVITSRQRLGVPGEWVIAVEPMAWHGLDDEEGDAVRLFLAGAKRAAPHLDLSTERPSVARLCQLLGGLPLAIELASAWVWALTLEEIEAGIRANLGFLASADASLDERHRSLLATFDYGWSLLSERERRTLARLSVFYGGFTMEAACAVAEAAVSDVIALLGRSLVSRDTTGRFTMQALLQRFVNERLAHDADAASAARRRHRDYFVAWLAALRPQMYGEHQKETLLAIESDLDNARAALAWREASSEATVLVDAISPLWTYFDARGRYSEGIGVFQPLIDNLPRDEAYRLPLAHAHVAQAWYLLRLCRYDEASARAHEGLELLAELASATSEAVARSIIGTSAWRRGVFGSAKEQFEHLVTLFDANGDAGNRATYIGTLGLVEMSLGDLERAEAHLSRSLELNRAVSHRAGEASNLCNLADLMRLKGRVDAAQALAAEGMALAESVGIDDVIPHLMNVQARLALDHGDLDAALAAATDANGKATASGDDAARCEALLILGEVAERQGERSSRRYRIDALRIAHRAGDVPLMTASLLALADYTARAGDTTTAVRWWRLVAAHPGSEARTKDRAERRLAELGRTGTEPTPEEALEPVVAALIRSNDAAPEPR